MSSQHRRTPKPIYCEVMESTTKGTLGKGQPVMTWLRRITAAVLFLAAGAPAFAQNLSHCDDTDPGEIWCASLTVGQDPDDSDILGYSEDFFGTLSPDFFGYDVNGTNTNYEVNDFYYESGETPPRFVFVENQGGGAFDGQSDLKLTLGTVELSFPTGTFTNKGDYAWENPGLSWSDGDVVPVKLVRIPTAPTASNGTVTTNEDTDYAFTASDFNFSDAGDALESVKIVTLPASGELQLNNAAIGSVPQTVTKAQLDAGNFKYVPPANASGTGYTSFTFKVNDGELDSMADYTMTIDVTAVADTPACAPPALTARRRVWQQTLTVGSHEAGLKDELIGYGWFRDTGTLSGRSVPIDLGTNRYRIGELVMLFAQTGDLVRLLTAPPGALVFHLVGETNPDAELTATEKAGLTLHVCGQAFTFASATRVGGTTLPAGPGIDRHYIWETAGLTWSDGLVRTLTLSMPTSMQVVVDPPEVDRTPQVSGTGTDGSWSAGESVEVALSFSEAVDVDISGGTPSLEIRLGGTAAHSAEYLSGSGTSELVFGYTLGNSESSYTSVSVTPNSLALNGGTIRSAETQVAALLAHNGTVVQGSSTRNTRNEHGPGESDRAQSHVLQPAQAPRRVEQVRRGPDVQQGAGGAELPDGGRIPSRCDGRERRRSAPADPGKQHRLAGDDQTLGPGRRHDHAPGAGMHGDERGLRGRRSARQQRLDHGAGTGDIHGRTGAGDPGTHHRELGAAPRRARREHRVRPPPEIQPRAGRLQLPVHRGRRRERPRRDHHPRVALGGRAEQRVGRAGHALGERRRDRERERHGAVQRGPRGVRRGGAEARGRGGSPGPGTGDALRSGQARGLGQRSGA